MTQLPGLVVTVCWTKHASLSISGRVHNRHCYCYWCETHITVIGPLSPILRFCYWYHFDRFQKWFSFAIIYIASVLKNIMLLLPKIIATIFEMVFDGYYINRKLYNCTWIFEIYFHEIFWDFPTENTFENKYTMTCNLFWKNS